MDEIKAGDIVNLRSGSPAMTASHQDEAGSWVCLWFRGDERCQGTFPSSVLASRTTPSK